MLSQWLACVHGEEAEEEDDEEGTITIEGVLWQGVGAVRRSSIRRFTPDVPPLCLSALANDLFIFLSIFFHRATAAGGLGLF